MTNFQEKFDAEQLGQLILFSLDESASEPQVIQLNEILRSSPGACEFYIEFIEIYTAIRQTTEKAQSTAWDNDRPMDSNVSLEGIDITKDVLSDEKEETVVGFQMSLDGDLMQALQELAECERTAPEVIIEKPAVEEPEIRVVDRSNVQWPTRKINKISLFTAIFSTAAVLLFIITLRLLPSNEAKPVASLVHGLNARWSHSGELVEDGARLWNDGRWYTLDQGMAEIVFDSGAKVLIEAPSQFQFINENEMDFAGTLTAEVPESAHGFTINTGNSKVVDLGTEFGIKTSPENDTEVHVKKGKVEIAETVSGRKNPLFKLIESGQGYLVSPSGKLASISFKKKKFRWNTSNPYEQAVLKTQPLYYWRFDQDRDGFLRNEIDSSLNDEYKLFGSIGYSEGPDLDGGKNVALRLTGSEEDYAILRDSTAATDNADGFTIAMWVRPEKANSAFKNNIIMRLRLLSGEGNGRRRSFGFDEENRFYFNSYSKDDTETDDQAESLEAISVRSNPVAINIWHHVAVTYTKSDRINLYVDGTLQASEKLQAGRKLISIFDSNTQWCVGSAQIDKPTHTSFTGSIDEICQHNRGLTEWEVQRIYKAADKK